MKKRNPATVVESFQFADDPDIGDRTPRDVLLEFVSDLEHAAASDPYEFAHEQVREFLKDLGWSDLWMTYQRAKKVLDQTRRR